MDFQLSERASDIQQRAQAFFDEKILPRHRDWTAHRWATGGAHPECEFLIVIGVSDPDANRTSRQSMVIVPTNTPGLKLVRESSYTGWKDHVAPIAEFVLDNVEVPLDSL